MRSVDIVRARTGVFVTSFCTTFAHWAADAVLPETARNEVRLSLLDTVACMIAGWDAPQTRAAQTAFGAEETATATALMLGTAAHALDFDDYEVPGSTHPSAPILGALLALTKDGSARLGDLLDAYTVGFEAIVRLGEMLRYDHYNAGWHATGTLGTVGAAAASARLLGLDASASTNALAISASLAGGLKAQFGTDTKALHAGLAARAGVEASSLAAAGATGAPHAFEGDFGFAALHHGAVTHNASILDKIGSPLGIDEHAILRKPWPSCAYTHRVIDAALTLHPRLPKPSSWKRIVLRMPEPFFRVSGFLIPKTANEARFSATYTTVVALLDGAVGPESFQQDAWLRPAVTERLAIIEVDTYDPGPALADMSADHPDTITVHMADGSAFSETIRHVAGGPIRPMTPDQLRAKFDSCGGDAATAELIMTASFSTHIALNACSEGFEIVSGIQKI
ncbi:MAG: MmgE/PrpD family protein [Pseudomonadota bacterium]